MKLRQIPIHSWTHYLAAIALVALAAAARLWPLGPLASTLTWLTFYPAVAVAAIYGGATAGLLAVGLSCVAVAFLWPLFAAAPFLQTPADGLGMVVFGLLGAVVAAVCEAPRRALARMEVFRSLVITMDDGFCVVEILFDRAGKPADYRFLETNHAFAAQTGLTGAKGRRMRDMVPDHEEHWFEIYGKVARTGEEVRFENPATAMGKYYDVFAFRIGGPGSRKVGISFKDISERKEAERQLIATARYDALTGLPNRAMFHEHLARALPRVERERTTLALMFFDLDGFKAVNDSHGHQAGDRVLQVVAERLLACMRAGDMVARLGGDEFIILVENCPSDHLPEVAEKVLQAVAVPIEVDAGKVRVSASLGLSSYPDCAIDAEMLIHLADTAMYEAKRVGGGIYRASPPAPAGEAGQMAHPASASGG